MKKLKLCLRNNGTLLGIRRGRGVDYVDRISDIFSTDGPNGSYASNGEPYWTFAMASPVCSSSSVEAAISDAEDALSDSIDSYLRKNGAHRIEWRIRPYSSYDPVTKSIKSRARLAITEYA